MDVSPAPPAPVGRPTKNGATETGRNNSKGYARLPGDGSAAGAGGAAGSGRDVAFSLRAKARVGSCGRGAHKSTVSRFCVGARGSGAGAGAWGAVGVGGRAWNLPGSEASADSAASACGMRRMILPEVMRRPKPSWCAKAYPERTERRARRAEGVRGAEAGPRQRCRARSRSPSVGRVHEHASRHDTTGTIRIVIWNTDTR